MATTYALSAIIQPQYCGSGSLAAVTFAPAGGTVVPAGVNYQIARARFAHTTGISTALGIARVPNGTSSSDAKNQIMNVAIPIPTPAAPWVDLKILWGMVLVPGDSLYTLFFGTADGMIHADGIVITL